MASKNHNLENDNNQNDFKKKNDYKKILEKKKFELNVWKMRIETISNLIEKETKKKNEHHILMRKHYSYYLQKRTENCDYVQNLMTNLWLINLEDSLKDITTDNRNEKNVTFICIKLDNEVKQLKSLIQLKNLKKEQDQKLIKLKNTIMETKKAITIWNEYTLKVEKALSN